MKVGTALILFLSGAAFAVQDDASCLPAVRGTAHPVISAPGAMPADDHEAREQERKVQAWYLQQQTPVQVPVESRIIQFVSEPGGGLMNDGPDVVIDSGYVAATAADYEMDGTMWVAVSTIRDSAVRVYKSTNHGVSWSLVSRFYSSTRHLFTQLQLVVGQAESAFVFCYVIMPNDNGDLWQVRFKRDGSSFWARAILAGPDTINRVIVCRDYYEDYWLYACAGDVDATPEFDDFLMRSTDFGKTWAVLNTIRYASAGSYSAGAGKYLYFAGCPSLAAPGRINFLVNTHFGNPDSWYETYARPDTFRVVESPIIGVAFTRPESTAVIWVVYSHDYQNSGDLDVKYVYSTNRGRNWSSSYYLAGSSAADEHYVDLKNYTSLGNVYMNASYISEQSYRTVYRHWVSASNPTGWSDTLRINTNSAGTGEAIKPLLVYSPGVSGTGAGCAFVGSGQYRCYWNAPWAVGIAEERVVPKGKTTAAFVFPNPARRTVRFASPIRGEVRVAVYDALGRLVYSLSDAGGDNIVWNLVNRDGERISPGVYFVRLTGAEAEFTEQLVVE